MSFLIGATLVNQAIAQNSNALSVDLGFLQNLYPNNQLNVGFGLARDMISHVYLDRPFAPRDFDFAIVNSNSTKEEAMKNLSRFGKVVHTVDMFNEVIKPSGAVFSYYSGFAIIVEAQGIKMDFFFVDSYESAHERGLFNVEKILFPMNGQTLSDLISQLQSFRARGERPSSDFMLDPHRGFEGILDKSIRTVNWGMARAKPLDWVIRGAMALAKLGTTAFPKDEVKIMREAIKEVRYIHPNQYNLFERIYNHPRLPLVHQLLQSIDFFSHFESWRWNQPVREYVLKIKNRSSNSLSCSKIFSVF